MTGYRRNELDLKPCGTMAAYTRHRRHGEKPCESCRQAAARDWQDRRAARKNAHRDAS
jgi:hypothetical protein